MLRQRQLSPRHQRTVSEILHIGQLRQVLSAEFYHSDQCYLGQSSPCAHCEMTDVFSYGMG